MNFCWSNDFETTGWGKITKTLRNVKSVNKAGLILGSYKDHKWEINKINAGTTPEEHFIVTILKNVRLESIADQHSVANPSRKYFPNVFFNWLE
jgi:hypothetical protein